MVVFKVSRQANVGVRGTEDVGEVLVTVLVDWDIDSCDLVIDAESW